MKKLAAPQTQHGSNFEPMRVVQFTIFLENRVGRLAALARTLEQSPATLVGMSVQESADAALVRIRANSDAARAALESDKFCFSESDLLAVEFPEESADPLSSICNALLTAEINIYYAYPLLARPRRPALALFVEDPTLAGQILMKKGFIILGESDLKGKLHQPAPRSIIAPPLPDNSGDLSSIGFGTTE